MASLYLKSRPPFFREPPLPPGIFKHPPGKVLAGYYPVSSAPPDFTHPLGAPTLCTPPHTFWVVQRAPPRLFGEKLPEKIPLRGLRLKISRVGATVETKRASPPRTKEMGPQAPPRGKNPHARKTLREKADKLCAPQKRNGLSLYPLTTYPGGPQ